VDIRNNMIAYGARQKILLRGLTGQVFNAVEYSIFEASFLTFVKVRFPQLVRHQVLIFG
jgi:hypothetical protein